MSEQASTAAYLLKDEVLRCLSRASRPLGMREIKDWIGRHVKLSPDDLRLISYPSGKEMRAFEVTVANLISNSRRSNLTAKGLVASLGHDQFQITPAGRKVLDQADAARELLLKIIGDVDLSED